jgi:thymidylate synthase
MKYKFIIITAFSSLQKGIGFEGNMPWKTMHRDICYFQKTTMNYTVVMGRKTYESIGHILDKRRNIILSNTLKKVDGAEIFTSVKDVCENVSGNVFIIGGEQIYKLFLPIVDIILCTIIEEKTFDRFDTFFPYFDMYHKITESKIYIENNRKYKFTTWIKNIEEYKFIQFIKKVIDTNNIRKNRTNIPTLSIFAPQKLTFSLLDNNFPLLTTKRVFYRGIVEELLWFISGSTDAKLLQKKKIHIWDHNSSREYLDSVGLINNSEGQLGPIYGKQWRNFGNVNGVDQLKNVVHLLKTDPYSRRIILSAWNPEDQSKMALPPCHILSQFYVSNDKKLSCQLYQRSVDLACGAPFNIASYALLTIILAYVCDLIPHKFIYCMGDAHIYKNHIESFKQQEKNNPLCFPKLFIEKKQTKDIDSFTYNSFILKNYRNYGKIKYKIN